MVETRDRGTLFLTSCIGADADRNTRQRRAIESHRAHCNPVGKPPFVRAPPTLPAIRTAQPAAKASAAPTWHGQPAPVDSSPGSRGPIFYQGRLWQWAEVVSALDPSPNTKSNAAFSLSDANNDGILTKEEAEAKMGSQAMAKRMETLAHKVLTTRRAEGGKLFTIGGGGFGGQSYQVI